MIVPDLYYLCECCAKRETCRRIEHFRKAYTEIASTIVNRNSRNIITVVQDNDIQVVVLCSYMKNEI